MILEFVTTLALFFLIGTTLAYLGKRLLGRGSKEFFVAGYRVGGFISAMTYAATTYSAFMMIGLTGLTFATGIASLGFELVYLASTVLLISIIGARVWIYARERGWISPSDMLSDLYSSKALGVVVAILYLFALIPYTSAQLKGVGELFAQIGLANGYEIGVAFAATATLLWTVVAGMWSVAITDAYQGIWMLGSAIAITVWLYAYLLPSADIDYARFVEVSTTAALWRFNWSAQMFIGMTLPWLFFALTNPQVVQRLYIPKDEKAFRRMLSYFATYGLLYTIICVALGIGYRVYMDVTGLTQQFIRNRDAVAPYIIARSHVVLASVVYTSIVAAAISTADSIVLSVASAIAREFYEKRSKVANEKASLAVSYIVIVVMLALASFFAIARIGYVAELSVASSAYLLPLAPITLAGLFRRRRRSWQALASLALGEAVALHATIVYGPAKMLTAPLYLNQPAPLWILLLSSIPLLVP